MCSNRFFGYSSECLIYAISEGVDEKYYHRLVLDSLKNLVVLADIEKTTLIISDVLWDQNMRKSHHRQSFFERRGVRVQPRPILVSFWSSSYLFSLIYKGGFYAQILI